MPHPILSALILTLLIYDSSLFYLVYLKPAPLPQTQLQAQKVLSAQSVQNSAPPTPTSAPAPPTLTPTPALTSYPTSSPTRLEIPPSTEITPTKPAPTPAPSSTPTPTPLEAQPLTGPTSTPTLALTTTPAPNSPASTASTISQLLTTPDGLSNLYNYLSSDVTSTFSPTDWQDSISSSGTTADSFSLVGEPATNNNWAEQEILLTFSNSTIQRYIMVLKLENGEWKLFGTIELE